MESLDAVPFDIRFAQRSSFKGGSISHSVKFHQYRFLREKKALH